MRSKLLACLLACHIPVIHVPCESRPGRHVSSSLSSLKRGEAKDKKKAKETRILLYLPLYVPGGTQTMGLYGYTHVTEGGCGCARDSPDNNQVLLYIVVITTVYYYHLLNSTYSGVQTLPFECGNTRHAPFTRPSK